MLISLFTSDRQSSGRNTSRSSANSDVLEGWQFDAHLSLHTSLEALEHHGEVRKGSRRNLPNYGNSADGVWLPKTALSRDRLRGLKKSGEPGKYLRFLKDFRKIVEKSGAVSEKLEALQKLEEQHPEYREFFERLSDNFAEKFFAKQLCEIAGIGEVTAQELFRNGFHSISELCAAEDQAILDVPGIGKGTLRSIRSFCGARS